MALAPSDTVLRNTEIGWPTANGVDESAQARWVVRDMMLAALGVTKGELGVTRDPVYIVADPHVE